MTSEASVTRRYLALFLPWLPAEQVIRTNAAPPESVFALAGSVLGTVRIIAVSAAAAGFGLSGLTIADAHARLPELTIIAHNAAADAALLEYLAADCEIFSPTVSLDPPYGIIIDTTGCLGDFADESSLIAAVSMRLEHHGMTVKSAAASTPDAAAALVRFGVTAVADLPVAALRIDDAVHQALGRAGLTTIGSLAIRPRATLAARFGEIVPTLLSRLLGEHDVRLSPRRIAAEIIVEQHFTDPLIVKAVVHRAIDRLMIEAAVHLAERDLGGRRFEAALFRSDGHVARLNIGTGKPTRDPKLLSRLIAERIEALADPLDPGFGYDLIRLAVTITEPLCLTQPMLDREGVVTAAATTLIDRLTTRLGSCRIRRMDRGASHIPELASYDSPIDIKTNSWPAPDLEEPPQHPLHLLSSPRPIKVIAEVPDGPPRSFRWQRIRYDIIRAEGPERIAAEWWRLQTGAGKIRDYFRVEDIHGRRFWIYRCGFYGGDAPHPDWYLHGVFA